MRHMRVVLILMLLVAPVCASTVAGTIRLDLDDIPAADLEVRLLDRRGTLLDSTRTDDEGRFGLRTTPMILPEGGQTQISADVSRLLLPYPNPFNPTIHLPWSLSRLEPMQLVIYNALGQPIRHLLDGLQSTGDGQTTWDGRDDAGRAMASGLYLAQLRTPRVTHTRSILLIDGAVPTASSVTIQEPLDLVLQVDGLAITPTQWQVDTPGDQGTLQVGLRRHQQRLPQDHGAYDMVGVPAGSFSMGSDEYDDEQPVHAVRLSAFLLGITEVTVAAYARCVAMGVCDTPAGGEGCNDDLSAVDRQQHPANCVTWYDAATYCAWAGMRLPTEAQWEKAARGPSGSTYPWGNDLPGGAGNCDRAVMMRAGLGLGCGHDGTGPVGERPGGRNVYGIDDLAGNVWEWTADAYDAEAYDREAATDPHVVGAPTDRRSVRGNSWYYVDPNPDLRAANRYAFPAMRWLPFVGFRCAVSDQVLDLPAAPPGPLAVAHAVDEWLPRNQVIMELEADRQPAGDVPGEQDVVRIPTGSLIMGSADGDSDERPLRRVWIDAFVMDRYEVTVAQYGRCVAAGVCREPHHTADAYRLAFEVHYLNWGKEGRSAHPINGVSWYDAETYCRWAEKRLPTEAEWEWAARGSDGRLYPWGNDQVTCQKAIMDDGGDGCGHEMAWPVGSRSAGGSPFGVQDMAGNLWEWTADYYARDFYSRGGQSNPYNDEVGEDLRVLRGGSMADQNARILRSTNRLGYLPDQRYDYTVGFRCAADDVAP